MEERKSAGRPPAATPLTWRAVVRLPEELGEAVEEVSRETMTPVAVLLRTWINEGYKRAKASGDGR